MTEAGLRFLDAADHPLASAYLAPVRERYGEITEDILLLFEDAQACLDHNLLRPAAVLLGLAYDIAVNDVLTDLAAKALVEEGKIKRADGGDRVGWSLSFIITHGVARWRWPS